MGAIEKKKESIEKLVHNLGASSDGAAQKLFDWIQTTLQWNLLNTSRGHKLALYISKYRKRPLWGWCHPCSPWPTVWKRAMSLVGSSWPNLSWSMMVTTRRVRDWRLACIKLSIKLWGSSLNFSLINWPHACLYTHWHVQLPTSFL